MAEVSLNFSLWSFGFIAFSPGARQNHQDQDRKVGREKGEGTGKEELRTRYANDP